MPGLYFLLLPVKEKCKNKPTPWTTLRELRGEVCMASCAQRKGHQSTPIIQGGCLFSTKWVGQWWGGHGTCKDQEGQRHLTWSGNTQQHRHRWSSGRRSVRGGWVHVESFTWGQSNLFPIQHHHLGGNAGTKEVEGPRAGVSKTTRSKASRVHWKGHRVMPSSELRVARQSSQCFMRKKDHRFLCEI